MGIDYKRIAAIVEELRPLTKYQAYYVKNEVKRVRIGPMTPPIEEIIRQACEMCPVALDVGFGDGHTLLDNADVLDRGVGVDDSEYMIELANSERRKLKVDNIEFQYGQPVALPFDDECFDLVFSQRGPLGHSDGNLSQALRVLRQGGLILIETGGGFDVLKAERNRFVEQGVSIHIAATFKEMFTFPDPYEFFRHYCVSWASYDEARNLDVSSRDAIDKVLLDATDATGELSFHWRRILIGGRKE